MSWLSNILSRKRKPTVKSLQEVCETIDRCKTLQEFADIINYIAENEKQWQQYQVNFIIEHFKDNYREHLSTLLEKLDRERLK